MVEGLVYSKSKRSIEKGHAPEYYDGVVEKYFDSAHKRIKRRILIKEGEGRYKRVLVEADCPYPEDSQRHFLTLWISGTREEEAITITTEGWKWNDEAIRYQNMPVFKKREKVRDSAGDVVYRQVEEKVVQQDGSILTQIIYRPLGRRKEFYRDHYVPRDIPLGEKFIDMIHELREDGIKYLLYKKQKFTREAIINEACTRGTVYNRIVELHEDLFPHSIRALHGRFIDDRYGDSVKDRDGLLQEHFKWSTREMASHYRRTRVLKKVMRIKKLPE